MVKGLDRFKEHFAPFNNSYMLIGGTACMLTMEEAGLDFRATKDLDIVLTVEALDGVFVEAFWQFIRDGGYQNRQKSTGKQLFYRFHSPTDASYPEMLELFSRKPDEIDLSNGSHLTPIPIDEEISSLSAILLDEDYYHFIHAGKSEIEGLSVLSAERLIPLKARAWIDLSSRSDSDAHDVRKHKNDIIRLHQLLPANLRVALPKMIKRDMTVFLDGMRNETPMNLKMIGVKNTSLPEVLSFLREVYDC